MTDYKQIREDAAAEKWMRAVAEEAAREDEEQIAKAPQQPGYRPPSPEWTRETRSKIYRALQETEQRRKRASLRRRIRIVAILAAVLTLLCGTVVAADQVGWLHAIVEQFEEYTWSWSARTSPLAKPEGWDSEYYPTWVPDGFVLAGVENKATAKTLRYTTSKNEELLFKIQLMPYTYDDTEKMKVETVQISNTTAQLYISPDSLTSTLILPTENGTIVVSGDVNGEETIEIAKSINSF